MLRKFMSTCVSGSGSYDGAHRVEAFYSNLSAGLMDLGDSVQTNSPPFSLESLRLAVDFVRSMHSDLLALIEEIWVPAHIPGGMDVLNNYMDVSKRLLDMCICITNAMGQLESYQMSLEVALTFLSSAVKSLSVAGDDSTALNSISACRTELRRMESKKHIRNLWAEFVSNYKDDRVSESKVEASMSGRLRSVTSLPSSRSLERKALEISLVMVDVQSIATSISSMILWVLTESSEQYVCPVDLDDRALNSTGNWSASLHRLTEKVTHAAAQAEGKENTKVVHIVHRLREFEGMHSSMYSLCETIEEGLKHSEKTDVWLRETSLMLTQTSEKLAKMLTSLEKLGVESQKTFSEISSRRRNFLDIGDKPQTPRLLDSGLPWKRS